MSKQLHTELYKEYLIVITGTYVDQYYSFRDGITKAVMLDYWAYDENNEEFPIESKPEYQRRIVAKEKPFKFLFFKSKPKQTFKEQVEDSMGELIEYIHNRIDRKLLEKEVTEGLLDSLDTI